MIEIGVAVMVAINVIFVPKIGYWACAWGGFAGYGTSMLLSWFIGQKKYPIPYDLKTIGLFTGLALLLYAAYVLLGRTGLSPIPMMAIGTLMLLAYCAAVWRMLKKRPAQ